MVAVLGAQWGNWLAACLVAHTDSELVVPWELLAVENSADRLD